MSEPAPRWVRVVSSVDLPDPWSLLTPLRDDGERLMAWASPHQAVSFVAVGAVLEHRPSGADRFAESARWWGPIARSMVSQDADGRPVSNDAPACLAGFALQPSPLRSDSWQPWGDAALCVPEVLLWTRNNRTSVVFTIDSNRHDVAEKTHELRTKLSGWLDGASPPDVEPATPDPIAQPHSDSDWTQWRDRVQSAQQRMADGTLTKVVLARAQSYSPADAHTFDPLATALALRNRQVDSTTFLICRRDGRAFLGSSPEVLVRLQDKAVETVALAGTRRRGKGRTDFALGEALMDSDKDRLEQQLVASAITDALASVTADLELSAAPELVRHPDVQHLRTAIRARLNGDATIFDLVQQLHPTPAVGGLPRDSALKWLGDNEHLDRGWYAGPVGWLTETGDGEFVVAIRSVLMEPNTASAFAGCGLVSGSDPADEWEESRVKLQTVRRGLATGLSR